jgi:hypothetical protein
MKERIYMKRLVLTLLLLTILPACSSNKIKPVDEPLDVKAKLGDQEIGMNEDDEGIIQDSVAVEDELRALSWKNYDTERKLKQERFDLVQCRTELADPRLSGNKKLEAIPELEISENLTKVQEKIGITQNGRIKVVKKQFINERIEKEREYRDSLDKLVKVIHDNRIECERDLGYTRVAHGLPSQRYTAEGYYGPHGNFIVTRPAERNLDDAFRILAEQTRQGKKLERKEKVEASAASGEDLETEDL